MALTEVGLHRIWAAKQTAQGTPATVATQSFKYVAGDALNVTPDTGSVNWSDGTPFGGTTQYLNSVLGQGNPSFEGGTDQLAWLLWLMHGAETVTPSGTNEVQTLTTTGTPTGGTVPLNYDGRATTVAFNATAAATQTALEALPNIGTGGVVCTGGPLPTAVTITFSNQLQKRPVPNIVTGSTGLTGGSSPTGVIVETTPGVNALHTFTPQSSLGFWSTWWETVGVTTASKYQLKYNDVRCGGVTIEASTGTKDLRVSPQLMSIDPGEKYSTDPVLALPTAPVMIFTEGSGGFKIDGTVYRGLNQLQLALAYNLAPVYGDSTTPFDMARGTAGATVTVTAIADDAMKQQWFTWLYGTPTPADGQKPLQRIAPIGSIDWNLSKKDTANNTIGTFSGTGTVQWQVPNAPAPNPDSGSAEISITGTLQPLGATPLYTMNVGCQQAAFTG